MSETNRKFLIFSIFVIAVILRIWAIDWGLPYLYHPDEGIVVETAFHFRTGDLNPHNFLYPTLSMYLIFFIYNAWYMAGSILHYFNNPSDFDYIFTYHVEYFYLVARLFVAFLGVMTIWILYKLVKEHFGRTSAIFASLFLSLNYIHVQNSKYATVDVPMVFFLMLALYFIIRISQDEEGLRNYILSAIFSACAITTKQTGVFVIAPLLVAEYLYNRGRRGYFSHLFLRRAVIYTSALLITVFITSPYIFLDFKTFWSFVIKQSTAMKGWLGSETDGVSYLYYLKLLSIDSKENIYILTLSIIGLYHGFIKERKKTIIFATYPVIYLLIVGSWSTHFPRYAIPLIPFMSGFAGIGVSYIASEYLSERRRLKAYTAGVLGIFIILNLVKVTMLDIILTHKDTREVAKEWIEENIPEGSRIAYETYAPQLDIKREKGLELIKPDMIVSRPLSYYAALDVDYIIISSFFKERFYRAYKRNGRYEIAINRYEALKIQAELVKVFDPDDILPYRPVVFYDEFKEIEVLNCRHDPVIEIYRMPHQ